MMRRERSVDGPALRAPTRQPAGTSRVKIRGARGSISATPAMIAIEDGSLAGQWALSELLPVGSKPMERGRCGHQDLGGSAQGLVRDWLGEAPTPCIDCAVVDEPITGYMDLRGGGRLQEALRRAARGAHSAASMGRVTGSDSQHQSSDERATQANLRSSKRFSPTSSPPARTWTSIHVGL